MKEEEEKARTIRHTNTKYSDTSINNNTWASATIPICEAYVISIVCIFQLSILSISISIHRSSSDDDDRFRFLCFGPIPNEMSTSYLWWASARVCLLYSKYDAHSQSMRHPNLIPNTPIIIMDCILYFISLLLLLLNRSIFTKYHSLNVSIHLLCIIYGIICCIYTMIHQIPIISHIILFNVPFHY